MDKTPKKSKRVGKKTASRSAAPKSRVASKKKARAKSAQPVLLSSGNPQIAKAYGDAPVQSYIDAMPGWKRAIGRRLDALVVRTVPDVHKAVKWNTPFYGLEENHWFFAFYCYTKKVQVTFFRGTSLHPVPPKTSKIPDVRYFEIHEDDELDERQLADWIRQAAALPGVRL